MHPPAVLIRLGRPDPAYLENLLETAAGQAVTYHAVGATRGGAIPAGYRVDRVQHLVRGPGALGWAKVGLLDWVCHAGVGAEVHPTTIAEGVTVLVSIHWSAVYAVLPCRIVYVVDDPDAYGFAYGTLPGHPERGEELFIVEREGTDAVCLRIEAFSKPAGPFVHAVSPLSRLIQYRTTARYLSSLVDFVERGLTAPG